MKNLINWLFKTDRYWKKKCERLEEQLREKTTLYIRFEEELRKELSEECDRYRLKLRETYNKEYAEKELKYENIIKAANQSIDILLKSKEIQRMQGL